MLDLFLTSFWPRSELVIKTHLGAQFYFLSRIVGPLGCVTDSFQIPQKISRFESAACEVSSWVIWDWNHMSCWLQGALWESRKCLGGENWSFGVEMTPKAVGCWGTVPRHTLTRYIKIHNQVFNRDNMHKMDMGVYPVCWIDGWVEQSMYTGKEESPGA